MGLSSEAAPALGEIDRAHSSGAGSCTAHRALSEARDQATGKGRVHAVLG
jgi:hypothetical protein